MRRESRDLVLVPLLRSQLPDLPRTILTPQKQWLWQHPRTTDLTQTPPFPVDHCQQRQHHFLGQRLSVGGAKLYQTWSMKWADWSVGTYEASFWGLMEFIGAYLGWKFTPQFLLAFPIFRVLRDSFPPRHCCGDELGVHRVKPRSPHLMSTFYLLPLATGLPC